MTTQEYIGKNMTWLSTKLNPLERARICKLHLQARELEVSIGGSVTAKNDARAMNIEIWERS